MSSSCVFGVQSQSQSTGWIDHQPRFCRAHRTVPGPCQPPHAANLDGCACSLPVLSAPSGNPLQQLRAGGGVLQRPAGAAATHGGQGPCVVPRHVSLVAAPSNTCFQAQRDSDPVERCKKESESESESESARGCCIHRENILNGSWQWRTETLYLLLVRQSTGLACRGLKHFLFSSSSALAAGRVGHADVRLDPTQGFECCA